MDGAGVKPERNGGADCYGEGVRDVEEVFPCVAAHRIILNMKAKVGHIKVEETIRQILENTEKPAIRNRR